MNRGRRRNGIQAGKRQRGRETLFQYCWHSYVFQFRCIQQTSYWTGGQNMLLPVQGTNMSVSSRFLFLSITQFVFFSHAFAFLTEMTQHCTFSSLFIFPLFFPHSSFFYVVLSSTMFFFLPAFLCEPHTPVRDEAVSFFVCVFVCVCV